MAKILIVNNAAPGITEFTRPLEKIVSAAGMEWVSVEYAECPSFDFSTVDGVILSGSPQGNDIVEHHQAYFQWIKSFEKPVLGICAGHHITGYLYGARLLRSEEPESGDSDVTIAKGDILFDGMPHQFKVKQMHNDSITLPQDFKLLAFSEICKNQIMKHRNKPLYTCQFHPEFYNHNLIVNFLKLAKPAGNTSG